MTDPAILSLIRQFTGQRNTLTIPRAFVRALDGDFPAAALLSQIVYWSGRTSDPEGWFWKTSAEWDDELCLSEYRVRKATATLLGLALIETKRAHARIWRDGVAHPTVHGGAPVVHYRINTTGLTEWITQFLQNGEPDPVDSGMESEETSEWNPEKPQNLSLDTTTTCNDYVQVSPSPSVRETPVETGASPVTATPETPPPGSAPPSPTAPALPKDTPHSLCEAFLAALATDPASISPAWWTENRAYTKRLLEEGYNRADLLAYLAYERSRGKQSFRLRYIVADIRDWEANGRPQRAADRRIARDSATSPKGAPLPVSGVDDVARANALIARRQAERAIPVDRLTAADWSRLLDE